MRWSHVLCWAVSAGLLGGASRGESPQALTPEKAALRAEDGFRLFGDYYRPPATASSAPMAILLHMYRSDRSTYQPLAVPLSQAGFAVLAIDLRGHGESATSESQARAGERDTTLFQEMQQDVRAAYDWLAKRPEVDRARFVIVGASVGCSIALQYAAEDRSVDAIVCLTPGLDYLGLKSEQDIRQIQGRKILLVATEDERKACDVLEKLTDGVTKRIAGGSAHGTKMFAEVSSCVPETIEFLKRNVGPSSNNAAFGSLNRNVYHEAGSGWIAEISRSNLRVYSSAAEAESRGLRKSRSKGPDDKPK